MRGMNLLVFRKGQRRASGQELKTAVTAQLEQACGYCSHQAVLDALLLAGELECGLADDNFEAARSCELLTDRIADALLPDASADHRDFFKPDFWNLLDIARALPAPKQLSISIPEGFAYYALHPLVYADVVQAIPACETLLVVGIRSIGTTLSAVVAAAARDRGINAERLTVRPQGHPYDRSAEFTSEQMAAVRKAISCGASFAVVDEGPGLSGSSFLAVAEALEQEGAPTGQILLISSHAPNVDTLCASDAARRWQRFRCVPVAGEARRPVEAVDFIGGGHWRNRLIANEFERPASWTSFERLKYLSPAGHNEPRMFKFAGLGHYGDGVFARERKIAAAGFGPMPRAESDGFVSYPWIQGRPLSASDLSSEILIRLAEYCAFRRHAFAVDLSNLDALQQMAVHNLHELGLDLRVELCLKYPVIVDGRMQPHEWLLSKEGKLLKTDSGSHGDDHFFPGPTDIAWDLAGAIVEWQMNEEQTMDFLSRYCCASGEDANVRIDGFIKAYAAFRSAYCLMAANAMSGSDEQPRLQRAADLYSTVLAEPKVLLSSLCGCHSIDAGSHSR
jgi:hypothetical protein